MERMETRLSVEGQFQGILAHEILVKKIHNLFHKRNGVVILIRHENKINLISFLSPISIFLDHFAIISYKG